MSSVRPECEDAKPGTYSPKGAVAYLAIYNAVKGQKDGLIHGRLDGPNGRHCAIGSYFDRVGGALGGDIVNEVATVNDSCAGTLKQRQTTVLRWLRWKLETLGYKMPGRKSSCHQK